MLAAFEGTYTGGGLGGGGKEGTAGMDGAMRCIVQSPSPVGRVPTPPATEASSRRTFRSFSFFFLVPPTRDCAAGRGRGQRRRPRVYDTSCSPPSLPPSTNCY